MKRMICLLLLFPLLLVGCGSKSYKMPREEYRERVRTLGVLPLMVDPDSTISHPERQEVVDLLRRVNSGKAQELVKMLRSQKDYFDVRAVSGGAQQLFSRLVSGATLRGAGDGVYRRYSFNADVASELTRENVVDGLLVLIFNGVERVEKRRDRGPLLTYLEAPYNSILVTAAVVLPSGELAWEYGGVPGEAFLPLQYPAFDEAYYNKIDEVRIKFISVPGLERTLTESSRGLFVGSKFPRVYLNLFEQIVAGLNPGTANPLKALKKNSSAPTE